MGPDTRDATFAEGRAGRHDDDEGDGFVGADAPLGASRRGFPVSPRGERLRVAKSERIRASLHLTVLAFAPLAGEVDFAGAPVGEDAVVAADEEAALVVDAAG